MVGGKVSRRTVESADRQPPLATDGGTNSSELGVVVIAVLSVLYFLLNLFATLAFFGLGGLAGGVGAGGAAVMAGIAAIVSLVLTIGFIAAPVGVFLGADWAWPAMAGVWALNLVWSVGMPLVGGSFPDLIGLVFVAINLGVLGWIYVNRSEQLPVGRGRPTV